MFISCVNNMFKLSVLFIVVLFALVCANNVEKFDLNNEEMDFPKSNNNVEIVIISGNIGEFTSKHPGVHVEYLQQKIKIGGLLHYSLGARTRFDHLVASGGNNQSWTKPQNVNTKLTYPSQGLGAIVTYVAIQVNQTSNLGQAYIVGGGIGQRFISVVVESYNTWYLNYVAYIYGA